MHIVDSHCHLNFPDFAEDLPAVIERAKDAEVKTMLSVCTKLEEFAQIHEIATQYDNVYCSVGIHPHNAANEDGSVTPASAIIDKAQYSKVIAIGETGLDYYYLGKINKHNSKEAQQQNFRNHIEAARQTGLPIIVHNRESDEDCARILEEEMNKGRFCGLIHCFSSSKELAEKAIAMGMYISLTGIITFKKSDELRNIVEALPIDRLLIETDAPYLAPTPHRGKRNEPSYTKIICGKLAEIKNISVEECARITTDNFMKLFNMNEKING